MCTPIHQCTGSRNGLHVYDVLKAQIMCQINEIVLISIVMSIFVSDL